MKVLLLFLCFGLAYSMFEEEELKCNFRICGAELLNFDHFSISGVFRKLEVGSFCVKNCTPPVVHEFFQGIIFAITKRIPGQCHGDECAEKNRFVSLSKCAEKKAWPLLECSKKLIDLAQVGLVAYTDRQKRNFTCSIVIETTQCLEEKLQKCGPHAFSLVKEIFVDVVKMGINAYCHPAYLSEHGQLSTTQGTYQERMKHFTDIDPVPGPNPYPQFVKGYRSANGAPALQSVTSALVVLCAVLTSVTWQMHQR